NHPDRDAREVRQAILEARAPRGRPQVAHLERLELVRLLGGEVVLTNQVRDAGQELLVLEHEDLGVEDAGFVDAGPILGFRAQVLEVALHILHRGAQPAHLFLDLGARHDAVRDLGHGPAHDDPAAGPEPGRDADPLELPVAHSRPSFSCCSASRISASRTSCVRCISWNPSATRASRASIADSASSPSVLIDSDDPHSAASIITPMMLLPFTARSSLRTSTADLKRLASFTNSAAGRACTPRGFTILASRSIPAIPTLPAPPAHAAPGRAAARSATPMSASPEVNGSHPAHTSRSPSEPSGPHSAVRKRSTCSGATPSCSARAAAPTARPHRYGCALKKCAPRATAVRYATPFLPPS